MLPVFSCQAAEEHGAQQQSWKGCFITLWPMARVRSHNLSERESTPSLRVINSLNGTSYELG